jgi:YjbE family integral membrane protein
MLAGGLALLWIAWKLARGDEGGDEPHPDASTFWAAMRTIVVADALMGIDNVLGVAGAAHGNFSLVVIGLALSVPIVVLGSALVLRLLQRLPWIVWAGAVVLAFTALQMIAGDPLVQRWWP